MKRIILVVLLSSIGILGFAQDSYPVYWKISSEKIDVLTYKLKFKATVDEPYHIYPQNAYDALGMPTEFLFVENPDVEIIGTIEEKGAEQTSEETLPYYSKGATFTQTVRLKSEKKTIFVFTIKYIACTNAMCLPPRSKQFTLALNDQDNDSVIKSDILTDTVNKQSTPVMYEDFVMPDTTGKIISSKEITSKSNYTYIDFWASWCIPCRAQGRELIHIYNKYKGAGFNVIGVSLDTKPLAWKKAILADGYSWTNISDLKGYESEIISKYGIVAIPRSFLIDNKGNIVAMDLHGKQLEEKLSVLLQ